MPVTRLLAILPLLILVGHSPSQTHAAQPGGGTLLASKEPGWPQWRGPRRDGVCRETGLLQSWPEAGPKRLWAADGLGGGYSSPIITQGTIYITGDVDKELHIFALTLDGKPKWRAKNGMAWTRNHRGARASCIYDKGRLYHMNGHGRVACFDPATGKELWAVRVLERFEARINTWGLAENVVVDGDHVIVTPGGKKAFMAALDRKTGATVWASEPLPNADREKMGYSSPILFTLGGRRLLVNLSQRSVVCVDADRGKLLWHFEHPTRYNASCATPVLVGDAVFHTNPTRSGGVLLRIHVEGEAVRAEPVWTCEMDNISGGAVAVDGHIYGSGEQNTGWVCMDARTGETKWESRELAQGSLICADRRLYCLSERGVAALVKASPKAFEIVGRFRLADGRRRDVWPHPVICDARLYLRYHDTLHCYDIRAK